jgi:hypothetical protein
VQGAEGPGSFHPIISSAPRQRYTARVPQADRDMGESELNCYEPCGRAASMQMQEMLQPGANKCGLAQICWHQAASPEVLDLIA